MLIGAPEGVAESLEFIGIASSPVEANIFATETFSEISTITEPLLKAMCDGKIKVIENFKFKMVYNITNLSK